jgi:glycosyltransferase involved in cell wall biosynthesis
LARSDWILCTSEELKRGILEAFPELEIKNISVAYNEVDTSLFKPIPEKEARNYLGIQEEGLHFLFVGNLVREKGVMDLIEVLIEMLEEGMEDRFFVHLVGTGPLYGNLKGLVHSRGLEGKIYVHGLVSPRQIPFWMNASNLLILPSEREGMPNVVMEAVYCGIPVLATNVGDIHVFIRNKENGYLISPENKKGELSIILKEIFSNPEQVVVMKSRLQKKILEKQNNKIPFLGDVTDIYKMLLRNRNVSLNHV